MRLDAAAASKLTACPVCAAVWTGLAAVWVDPPAIDRRVAWVCIRCGSWWRLASISVPVEELARLAELDPSRCQNSDES